MNITSITLNMLFVHTPLAGLHSVIHSTPQVTGPGYFSQYQPTQSPIYFCPDNLVLELNRSAL